MFSKILSIRDISEIDSGIFDFFLNTKLFNFNIYSKFVLLLCIYKIQSNLINVRGLAIQISPQNTIGIMFSSEVWLDILKKSPIPIAVFGIVDNDFTISFANTAYLELFEVKEAEVYNKSVSDLFLNSNIYISADFISDIIDAFHKVIKSEESNQIGNVEISIHYQNMAVPETLLIDIENTAIKENGVVKYISQTISKQQEPGTFFESTKSITKPKNRVELIEIILRNLPFGIAVNRIDSGEATLVNPQFSEIYGWNETDLIDIGSFFEKVYPDSIYRSEILKQVMDDINSGEESRMDWKSIEVYTSTGEKRIINAKNIPLFEQNLMISTVVDITQQAKDAAESQNTKVNQEALINSSDDLIWSVDSDYKIITANLAFLATIKHITGRNMQEGDLIYENNLSDKVNEKWKSYYDRAFGGENFTIKEQSANSLNGRIDYSIVSISPMRNKEGEIFGVACYSKDITKDTQALIDLQNAQNEIHRIMESSLDVICTIDVDGCFVSVSAAALTIWGYSPEELKGKSYMELVYEEDKLLTIEASKNIVGGKAMTNFENRYVRKDGSLISIIWSARWDEADQIMYCIAKDATEKNLAEYNLKNSEKRYRRLIENGADAVLILDSTGKSLYVSPSVTRVVGYTEEEMLSFDLKDLVHPSDLESYRCSFLESLQRPGEATDGHVSRIKHKDGSWRWLETNLTNMIDDPLINGIVDNFRDISKRMETEIEKNLLINNTEEYFVLLNTDLEIISFNNQFSILYDYYFNKVIEKGQSILDFAKPERRTIVSEIYDRVLLGATETSEIFVNDPFTQEERVLSVKYKPAKNSHDKIIGVFVTAIDITERQLVLDQLMESEKMYKLLFQYSPIPKFVYDLNNFQILEVNDIATSHYGFTRDEFLSKSILDITILHDRKRVSEIHKHIPISESVVNFGIFEHLKKNGGLIKSEIFGYKISYNGRDCMMTACNDVTERVEAFKRIQESETKLLAAQKIAKLGYWQSFPNSKRLYWSDEVYKIWGLDKESFNLDYDAYFNTIHPDDREEVVRTRNRVFEEGGEDDEEHRIILPDGSIKWVHALGNLVRNEKGEILIFEGTVQDITKDKLAIEKLQVSEARLKAIFESQTNYMLRTDLQGNYTFYNDKFRCDFGWLYEGKEIIGENSMSSILAYHHERVAETVVKCFEELNTVFQVFVDKPRKDGKGVVTTLWDFICLTDSKGKPSEIQCVGIDVSEWKRSQEALEVSNLRYEYVTRATSDAIWDWNLITDQMYRGAGFQTLFGYPVENDEIIGVFWENYIHPDDITEFLEKINNYKSGKQESFALEYRVKKSNGQYVFVEDKGILIKDKNGIPIKMVGAMQDITERKTYDIQLRDLNEVLNKKVKELAISNRELEEFAYVASHDLQEPLRMITSFLTQLQRKYDDQLDTKAQQYINFAVDGAKRMRHIILDLLDFSRVGRGDVEIESVNLNEVINEILSLFRRNIEETKAQFVISEMPIINIPKSNIRHLMQNLISNAIKYQPPGNKPLIEIGFNENPEYWEFRVRDNGIGISPEYFDKIFIVFQRLHTMDQYSGTGMGLAICRKIIENLGGKLWIESEEGKGSTFYFTVPKLGLRNATNHGE